jgi:hypothetical protein
LQVSAGGEGVMETFEGAKIWWTHTVHGFKSSDGSNQDQRAYSMKVHRQDRDKIIPAYLDVIRENAYNFQHKNR